MGGNPLFDRLTLHSRPPSLRVTLIAGGILLIISAIAAGMLVSSVPGLFDGVSVNDYLRGAVPPGWGVLPWPLSEIGTAEGVLITLLNLGALGLACFLTWREMRSDAFPLLKSSNVSASTAAAGLAGAALFRLRIPIVLAIVLLPLTVVPHDFNNYVSARFECMTFTENGATPKIDPDSISARGCVPADDPRVIGHSIAEVLPDVTRICGIFLLVALGASLTLWLRNPWVAGVIAAVGGLMSYVLLTAIAPMGVEAAVYCLNSCTWLYRWPPVNALTLVVVAAPFGLAWAAIRAARYRKTA